MTELVIMKDKQAVTTSLVLAETFEKEHKTVLRAIEDKIQSAQNYADYNSMFFEDEYEDTRGRKQKMYVMNRDGWSFIAFGFTGAKADVFKLRYIDAFNQMEEHIQSQPTLPTDPMELLKLHYQAQVKTDEKVDVLVDDVTYLKDQVRLDSSKYESLGSFVSSKIRTVIKERALNPKAQKPLRQELNRSINAICGVQFRNQIKEKDFETALKVVEDWQPSMLAIHEVRQLELELEQKNIA